MTETPPEVTTNDLIRGAMATRGYLQRDLGKVLGVAQNSVSLRMTGKQDWTLAELRKVAEWLQLDVRDLVAPSAPKSPAGAA